MQFHVLMVRGKSYCTVYFAGGCNMQILKNECCTVCVHQHSVHTACAAGLFPWKGLVKLYDTPRPISIHQILQYRRYSTVQKRCPIYCTMYSIVPTFKLIRVAFIKAASLFCDLVMAFVVVTLQNQCNCTIGFHDAKQCHLLLVFR